MSESENNQVNPVAVMLVAVIVVAFALSFGLAWFGSMMGEKTRELETYRSAVLIDIADKYRDYSNADHMAIGKSMVLGYRSRTLLRAETSQGVFIARFKEDIATNQSLVSKDMFVIPSLRDGWNIHIPEEADLNERVSVICVKDAQVKCYFADPEAESGDLDGRYFDKT